MAWKGWGSRISHAVVGARITSGISNAERYEMLYCFSSMMPDGAVRWSPTSSDAKAFTKDVSAVFLGVPTSSDLPAPCSARSNRLRPIVHSGHSYPELSWRSAPPCCRLNPSTASCAAQTPLCIPPNATAATAWPWLAKQLRDKKMGSRGSPLLLLRLARCAAEAWSLPFGRWPTASLGRSTGRLARWTISRLATRSATWLAWAPVAVVRTLRHRRAAR